MVGFVLGIIVVVCLLGGLFYGYSYLKAKASGKKVVDVMVGDAAKVVTPVDPVKK